MDQPRNIRIDDLELNWAKLDKPVSPFGTMQYELQVATRDEAKAQELRDNHITVKTDKDGKFVASLKRKAFKADGSDNGPVRVVDGDKNAIENLRGIGNGSVGNVILFQYPYSNNGRSGIATSLTAVQVTELEVYNGGNSIDFDVVGEPAEPTGEKADLF